MRGFSASSGGAELVTEIVHRCFMEKMLGERTGSG
jgi:hypothetical protein